MSTKRDLFRRAFLCVLIAGGLALAACDDGGRTTRDETPGMRMKVDPQAPPPLIAIRGVTRNADGNQITLRLMRVGTLEIGDAFYDKYGHFKSQIFIYDSAGIYLQSADVYLAKREHTDQLNDPDDGITNLITVDLNRNLEAAESVTIWPRVLFMEDSDLSYAPAAWRAAPRD